MVAQFQTKIFISTVITDFQLAVIYSQE